MHNGDHHQLAIPSIPVSLRPTAPAAGKSLNRVAVKRAMHFHFGGTSSKKPAQWSGARDDGVARASNGK